MSGGGQPAAQLACTFCENAARIRPKMRSTTAGLLLLIGSANSLSLGLAPVRRSAVHRIVMQVSEQQPH